MLPLQGARVRSLVSELRSHMPLRAGEKKERERERGRRQRICKQFIWDMISKINSRGMEKSGRKRRITKKNMCYIKPVTPVGN